MNKFLKKAEELKEERRILVIDIRKANTLEELDSTDDRIKSLRRKSNYIKKKIEKGCGSYLPPIGSYNSCGKKTPLSIGDKTIKYCKDCEEAKEIYKGLLKWRK